MRWVSGCPFSTLVFVSVSLCVRFCCRHASFSEVKCCPLGKILSAFPLLCLLLEAFCQSHQDQQCQWITLSPVGTTGTALLQRSRLFPVSVHSLALLYEE